MDTPPPARDSAANRLPFIIAVVVGGFLLLSLVIGLCAGLLLPALNSARNSARLTKSMSNLVQIGIALQRYSADNAGEFPENGADLRVRLARYIDPGSDVWDIPRPAGVDRVYYYVPLGNAGALKNPSAQPLMYEAPGLWRREGGTILYADGSIRHTDGLAYRTIIDGITLPDGTSWTPHKPK